MDKIFIEGIKCKVFVGATEKERRNLQSIVIDVELFFSSKKAAKTGNLNDTINYSETIKLVHELVYGKKFVLIETIAEVIAENCLKKLKAKEVKVKVFKPEIARKKNVEKIGIELERKRLL